MTALHHADQRTPLCKFRYLPMRVPLDNDREQVCISNTLCNPRHERGNVCIDISSSWNKTQRSCFTWKQHFLLHIVAVCHPLKWARLMRISWHPEIRKVPLIVHILHLLTLDAVVTLLNFVCIARSNTYVHSFFPISPAIVNRNSLPPSLFQTMPVWSVLPL